MAEEKEVKKLAYWTCKDLYPARELRAVGDVSSLVCSGMDPVATGGEYSLSLESQNEFALKILKTTEDTELQKTFEIAPYVVAKGDFRLTFVKNDEEVFEAVYKNFAVTSVLQGEKKPVPPAGPSYVLPSYTTLSALALLFILALIFVVYKSVKGFKKQNEYRSVIAKARYSDPFMDFNIELRELEKERKFSVLFLDRLEETFKKCFFRVFENNVFFDKKEVFFRSLKGLGAQPHEIRSFYVLEEEYRKFRTLYEETEGKVQEQKSEFINLSKKTVGKLKKYKSEID